MSNKYKNAQFLGKARRFLFIAFAACGLIVGSYLAALAQKPTPTPTPIADDDIRWNGYKVTSDTEFGFRASDVTGSVEKFKSDLNYSKGFRVFDTNLLMQSDRATGKYFDSLLISSSGWGSDPQGYLRVNMEKMGAYKFNATVR